MGRSRRRIRIELNPPASSDQVPDYYAKVEHLLERSPAVSLTSHRSKDATGFERSLSLVRHMRSVRERPVVDILFHLTCRDVDRSTLAPKLQQLEREGVRSLLLLSGEGYVRPGESDAEFADSTELLAEIVGRGLNTRFESLAIAGFPGGNKTLSNSNEEECRRLSSRLQTGAIDAIYTQCIFEHREFDEFIKTVRNHSRLDVNMVPSVALFKDLKSLDRVVRVTRVQSNIGDLRSRLGEFKDENDARNFSKTYLIDLCKALLNSADQINLCLFGQETLAEEILDGVGGSGPETCTTEHRTPRRHVALRAAR